MGANPTASSVLVNFWCLPPSEFYQILSIRIYIFKARGTADPLSFIFLLISGARHTTELYSITSISLPSIYILPRKKAPTKRCLNAHYCLVFQLVVPLLVVALLLRYLPLHKSDNPLYAAVLHRIAIDRLRNDVHKKIG